MSHLTDWRRALLAWIAGVVSVLAMAPFFFWPVLFLTLPTLVWMIDGCGSVAEPSERRRAATSAAVAGWWFGFGYFAAGLYWIGAAFLVEADRFAWAMPFAVTLLPAGLALFFALATGCARFAWRPGWRRLLVLAVALSAAEWLRGHILTGLPWNVLGYALTYPLILMQSASLVGIYGLTLVTVVITTAPLVLAAEARSGTYGRGSAGGVLMAALPLAVMLAYGAVRLAGGETAFVAGPRVRIVQPAIPQREKWLPEKQREIFLTHLDLSRRDPAGRLDRLEGITHVIWPEAAMPFMPLSSPAALNAIGELLPEGTQLISGALRFDAPADAVDFEPRRVFNSIMVFSDSGGLTALYDKIHLVPFGEYLPFQSVLEGMGLEQLDRTRGGFTSGKTPRTLLAIAGLPPVLPLVCYEAIFPAAVVQGGKRPGLLLNVTNDGWFGTTIGPSQHFHQARVRAVEEGLPLIRAANNGVSAIVDAHGRVLARLALDVRGVIDSGVPSALGSTLYSKTGDLLFLVLALACLVAVHKD